MQGGLKMLYLEMLELPPVIVQLPPLVFNLCLFLPLLLLQDTHVDFSVRMRSRYTPDGNTTTRTWPLNMAAFLDITEAADMQMTPRYSSCLAFLDWDYSSLWNFLL